ncbi:MAG: V-type ATPase subunit [Clostridia bacterium]|nr:V-type ATPase subunit [Clostridia bacterium]
MAVKYKDTDFMYSSARVRALENSLIGKEKLEHMLDSRNASDIIDSLSDFGFETVKAENGTDIKREDTLLSVLKKAYTDVSGMCGELPVLNFLRYQYDCNNVKAVIKCNSRGVDPSDMLFELGTVPAKRVSEIIRDKKYSELPPHMSEAAERAAEALASTANPQQVDLILDKACFADMLDSAKETCVDYITDLVKTKIDLINIMTCIRIIGMKLYFAAEPLMREAYIDGGSFEVDFFISGLEYGLKKLLEVLEYTPYAPLLRETDESSPLYLIEKAADNLWLEKAKTAKYVPFGAPVLVGYMIALEYEVKNIRIILAGKDAGLSSATIKERLRGSYV